MHQIFILDAFHPDGVALASQHAKVTNWSDPNVHNWITEADAIMVRMTPITREMMSRAKKLKVICKQGVGLDTIDLVAAKELGIQVYRTPGVNSEAVAEMAFSLTLSVCRRIARFDRLLRAGVPIVRPDHLGIEVWGKTVGVIGMGNIGTRVAKKWRGAFDAKLIAYDPHAPSTAWSDIEHERVIRLEDMLSRVDVLTLHLPLTPESHHLIGLPELQAMKKDAVLINVSRGGIVDERALYQVLKDGHLFGVGLDVVELEPLRADNPLLEFDQVIFTPHAAAGTVETQIRSATLVAKQVIDALAGLEVANRVV
jgi:D-3-phosphoglycerate dehydrogenase